MTTSGYRIGTRLAESLQPSLSDTADRHYLGTGIGASSCWHQVRRTELFWASCTPDLLPANPLPGSERLTTEQVAHDALSVVARARNHECYTVRRSRPARVHRAGVSQVPDLRGAGPRSCSG